MAGRGKKNGRLWPMFKGPINSPTDQKNSPSNDVQSVDVLSKRSNAKRKKNGSLGGG